jgi:hypothetical protein
MDFTQMPGFDIEADLAPLTALHNAQTTAAQQQQQQQQQPSDVQTSGLFSFSSPNTDFTQQLPSSLNGNTEHKVFFITNCGSLLGRTIAQVALDRGHFVAACAREKHLADLTVPPCLTKKKPRFICDWGFEMEN